MQLFGFEIKRKDDVGNTVPTFAPPPSDDGAIVVAPVGSWGAYGSVLDLDISAKTESQLITRYRDMVLHPEIDRALQNIINEAIVSEDGEKTVDIVLDEVDLPDNIKEVLAAEFDEALRLLEFNTKAYDVFKKWYVDGRIYYHAMVDEKKSGEGIVELRYLDPRKIRKIREIEKVADPTRRGATIQKVYKEYFIYSDKALYQKNNSLVPQTTTKGVKIAVDSIVHVTSGEVDSDEKMVLSHLHKAIKPLNLLRAIEDAIVIYRISRAPERRIFYVDIGSLPPVKAQQYIQDLMRKHKNKLVYDGQTGEVRDDRRFMTMIEDYWIPRREGSNVTEIDTLPAGENLGELADVHYFQAKLYESLNVPVSRLNPEDTFSLGRATEISRDEILFSKFIDRLRIRFSNIFLKILEKQVVLKNIMKPEEWKMHSYDIKFKFLRDNLFSELKNQEIWMMRAQLLTALEPTIGRFISNETIRSEVLRQSEDQQKEEDKKIESEAGNPQFNPPEMNFNGEMGGPPPPPPQGAPAGPPPTAPKPKPKSGAKK
jgi:hypothetical protein